MHGILGSRIFFLHVALHQPGEETAVHASILHEAMWLQVGREQLRLLGRSGFVFDQLRQPVASLPQLLITGYGHVSSRCVCAGSAARRSLHAITRWICDWKTAVDDPLQLYKSRHLFACDHGVLASAVPPVATDCFDAPRVLESRYRARVCMQDLQRARTPCIRCSAA